MSHLMEYRNEIVDNNTSIITYIINKISEIIKDSTKEIVEGTVDIYHTSETLDIKTSNHVECVIKSQGKTLAIFNEGTKCEFKLLETEIKKLVNDGWSNIKFYYQDRSDS